MLPAVDRENQHASRDDRRDAALTLGGAALLVGARACGREGRTVRPVIGVEDVRNLAREERADLSVLLRELRPEEWHAPSLCAGWTVRDVVTHLLSYEELSRLGLVRRLARGAFMLDRTNAVGLDDNAHRTPQQLCDLLDRNLQPRGLTALFGGRIALLDGMVHQQDIRRPLGRPREIPAGRMVRALAFARTAPPIGTPLRIRGLRLVATDVDWSAGRGPEVRGRGEALLLAMAGRTGVVDELDGPGRPVLAARTH